MSAPAEEWPLRDPPSTSSSSSSAASVSVDGFAGPRLAALLEQAPRFPKLPAADALIHGSDTQIKKKQEVSQKRQRQNEVEYESRQLSAAAAVAGRSNSATPAQPHRVRFSSTDTDHPRSNALFDSDEEKLSEQESGEEKKGVPATSHGKGVTHTLDEDPLYDPHADEEDEAWMRAQVRRTATQAAPTRGGRQQRKNGPGKAALAAAAAESAAAAVSSPHLSCPACFSPLCFDCQRHASRPNLFRAMFVAENGVIVDRGRQVRPEPGTEDPDNPQCKYYAVLCKTCKTHVAAMDEDEVFHFFNVLESQA